MRTPVGLPGFQLTQDYITAALAAANSGQSVPEPPRCPHGTWFAGGSVPATGNTCVPCPLGTDTEEPGAEALTACSEWRAALCCWWPSAVGCVFAHRAGRTSLNPTCCICLRRGATGILHPHGAWRSRQCRGPGRRRAGEMCVGLPPCDRALARHGLQPTCTHPVARILFWISCRSQ